MVLRTSGDVNGSSLISRHPPAQSRLDRLSRKNFDGLSHLERKSPPAVLDDAVEASAKVKIRNWEREAAHVPFADVDIALHVGEVLYGNVGAVDRLDFTVIGPAVNEWSEWKSL
jgi:class 3 adenylate cyclase